MTGHGGGAGPAASHADAVAQGPRIVLVGAPGAGKSSVGRAVAERLGLEFQDTDDVVVASQGKPVADIFVDHGEPHFRALETDVVARCLAGFGGVLALGGGAVVSAGTRESLRGHHVVFLDVGLSAAAHRVGLDTSRPLLAINPRATLRMLLEERRPLYEEVAGVVVDTDHRTIDEVADRVVELSRS